MGEIASVFEEIHDQDGIFKTSGYNWLKSSWDESKWTIVDTNNFELKHETINFEIPVLPKKTFLDFEEILEDIKRSIVIAVELRSIQSGWLGKNNSRSSIRRYAQNLMRVYREVLDMGFQDFSEITQDALLKLRDRLLLPEYITRSYPEKNLKVVQEVGIANIPISIDCSRKNPSSIDKKQMALISGIADYRESGSCMQIFNDLNQELRKLFPDYKWEESKNYDIRDYASISQAKSQLNTLKAFYLQCSLLSDFNAPLILNPFPDCTPLDFLKKTTKDKSLPLRANRDRTENMPVPVFLKLMDAAVRWVVDYADPLLEMERKLLLEFDELNLNLLPDRSRRLINQRVREISADSKWSGKPMSPFPLASFRHYRKPIDSKYNKEFVTEVKELIDQGLGRVRGGKQLGISPHSFDYIRYRFINDSYGHDVPTTGISLTYALYSYLPFCCAVILLAFTAGRQSSIADLRYGCIKKFAGLLYINLYIPKTLRRYEDIPTVALVEKAVSVLERLSAKAREETGSNRLFQFDDLVADRVKNELHFDNVYPNFFDFIGMENNNGESCWKLSEHQFRRFFAIMYFYRYGTENDASFEDLMYHLRHTDWTMADRYLTEQEAGRIFREVEEEWLSQLLVKSKPNDETLRNLSSEIYDIERSLVNNTKIVRYKDSENALKRVQDEGLVFEFLDFGAVCLGLSPAVDVK